MMDAAGEEVADAGARAAFVSYASADAALANALVADLEQRGIAC